MQKIKPLIIAFFALYFYFSAADASLSSVMRVGLNPLFLSLCCALIYPFKIDSLKPIQLPNVDVNEVKENRVESLCSLSIEEIMPIINSSKLYIGNDTGFMHLSAGLNVPAIGLFGDTPLSYANYNKNILPIIPENFKTIGHNSMAMNKITVDQVFNEVKKFI